MPPPPAINALRPTKPPAGDLVDRIRLSAAVYGVFGGDPRGRDRVFTVQRASASGHYAISQGYLTKDHALLAIPEEDVRTAASAITLLAPVMVGIDGVGWLSVRNVILGGEPDPQTDWRWALCRLGKPIWTLPPYMVLDSYDMGHEAVVTSGEAMGEQGIVQQIHGFNYTLSTGRAHRGECIGVPRTGTVEGDMALAPMMHRLPPGSDVWAYVSDTWRPGIVGRYRAGQVTVLLLDSGVVWVSPRSRSMLRERVGATPPATPRRPRVPRSPRFPQVTRKAPNVEFVANGEFKVKLHGGGGGGGRLGLRATGAYVDEAFEAAMKESIPKSTLTPELLEKLREAGPKPRKAG